MVHKYETDVVVVGAGNAAMCAAVSARENGAEVIVLEKAPESEKGEQHIHPWFDPLCV